MKKVVFLTSLTIFFLVLLKTAVFSHLPFFDIHINLILFIIVYVSIINGSITGMLCAFIAGLLLDFLSISPIGLHSFIFTLSAYIIGKFKGVYNMNKFLFPAFLGFSSFLFNVLLVFVLHLIFGENIHIYDIFDLKFLIQLVLNTLFCPLVFLFLQLFPNAFIVKETVIA